MRDIRNYFIQNNYWFNGVSLVNQTHDELSTVVKKEISEEVFNIMREKMENSLKLRVPLVVEGKITNDWFSAK
jgi:DNA polymerase-1